MINMRIIYKYNNNNKNILPIIMTYFFILITYNKIYKC